MKYEFMCFGLAQNRKSEQCGRYLLDPVTLLLQAKIAQITVILNLNEHLGFIVVAWDISPCTGKCPRAVMGLTLTPPLSHTYILPLAIDFFLIIVLFYNHNHINNIHSWWFKTFSPDVNITSLILIEKYRKKFD